MKKQLFAGITVFLSIFLIVAASWAAVHEIEPSPMGLQAHYPPKADGPVYLFRMLGLERAFSGIAAELTEDDLEGARKLYGEFVGEYLSVKEMVGEWKAAFPEGEVEALGRALNGTDRGTIFKTLEAVGEVCHRCHVAAMVTTQQKYRWGNFSALSVEDGNGAEAKPYAVFKKFLAANMAGVDVDAGQGQWENARRHFAALKERSELLSETCLACHRETPGNFTGSTALGLLEEELAKELPDRSTVSGLLKTFGGQTCAGCHLIHVPAAMGAAVIR